MRQAGGYRAGRAILAILLLGTMAVAGPPRRGVDPVPGEAPRAYPLRLPDMPLHDPWIVADRASRTYRLYTSNIPRISGTPGLGTMAYTSRNLRDWSRPRAIFVLPAGTWAKDGAWAPEVHRWRGRWYLFTTFHDEAATLASNGLRRPYRRGTILASADGADGPFRIERGGEPVAGRDLMTLDGTLHVDARGRPWIVYAHEWMQVGDGTIEAIPLDATLAAAGPPRLLFRASSAPWVKASVRPEGDSVRVTDGPELFRTRTGALLMLWSSYDADGYVQSQARSRSGSIEGPWEQLSPLVRADSGHGMLFRRFDGQLMMVLHRPFKNARGKLYAMRDAGDRLEVMREAIELDGETRPTHR